MEIKCPYCGKLFNAPPEDAGRMAACTSCHGRFQIPAPVAQIADPALARQSADQTAPLLDPAPAANETGGLSGGSPATANSPTGNFAPGAEKEVWASTPSQWIGFKTYFWCILFAIVFCIAAFLHPLFLIGLLFLPFIVLSKFARIKSIHYRLTTQRLKITSGIVSRKVVEVELFRIRDLSLEQGFLERLLGIGNVAALSSDKDAPAIRMIGIHQPQNVKEQLRTFVMESRQSTGTRDLDMTLTR